MAKKKVIHKRLETPQANFSIPSPESFGCPEDRRAKCERLLLQAIRQAWFHYGNAKPQTRRSNVKPLYEKLRKALVAMLPEGSHHGDVAGTWPDRHFVPGAMRD